MLYESRLKKAKFKRSFKKWTKGILTVGTVGGVILAGALELDNLTKRTDIPERNVIFRARQQLTYSGSKTAHDQYNVDQWYQTRFSLGGEEGSLTKSEDIIFTTDRHYSDDEESYQIKDKLNWRLANTTFRSEKVQAGMSISGYTRYTEEFGVIDKPGLLASDDNEHSPNSLIDYRFEPERGLDEIRLNVIKENNIPHLINKTTESRSFLIGWPNHKKGDDKIPYRAGTSLEKYVMATAKDSAMEKRLFDMIRQYNKVENKEDTGSGFFHWIKGLFKESYAEKRVKLLDRIQELEKEIPKKSIYHSFEDGIIDWNFQESTTFLGEDPSYLKRAWVECLDYLAQGIRIATLGFVDKSTSGRLLYPDGVIRVENHWGIWPGDIPYLNKWRYENGNRLFSLFDKTNNGGYEVIDNKGTLAQIVIEDFFVDYDKDVIYHYYLDKNGDGDIDKEKEEIGKVLFRITRGQENAGDIGSERDKSTGVEKSKKDLTFNIIYTFMGGYETDPKKRVEDLALCRYIESIVVNETNRGYGKHSRLGDINESGSDFLFFYRRTYPEFNRALTEECAMTAASDIYGLLKDAKRPFADEFARRIDLPHNEIVTPEQHAAPITKQIPLDSINTSSTAVPTFSK